MLLLDNIIATTYYGKNEVTNGQNWDYKKIETDFPLSNSNEREVPKKGKSV